MYYVLFDDLSRYAIYILRLIYVKWIFQMSQNTNLTTMVAVCFLFSNINATAVVTRVMFRVSHVATYSDHFFTVLLWPIDI